MLDGLVNPRLDGGGAGGVDLFAPLVRFLAIAEAAFHLVGKNGRGLEVLLFHVFADRLAERFEILRAIGNLFRGIGKGAGFADAFEELALIFEVAQNLLATIAAIDGAAVQEIHQRPQRPRQTSDY